MVKELQGLQILNVLEKNSLLGSDREVNFLPGCPSVPLNRRFNLFVYIEQFTGCKGISVQTTVWEVLLDNGLHPFHVQRVQELNTEDHPRRVQFARWFLNKEVEQPCFPSKVLFTDEASFTREGIVNLHNLHLWSAVNPHVRRQCKHQVRFSVNVWTGILGDHLIGPYILPGRQNGCNYWNFLNEVLPELSGNVPSADIRGMWFQHDGAPAHFAVAVRQLLDARYPNRWIGRDSPTAWPPSSPDTTPLHFYLWGHLKSLVYETPITSYQRIGWAL